MESNDRVLFINESPETASIVMEKLAMWDIPVCQKQATSLKDLNNLLNSGLWDVVISEYKYSGVIAFDVLKKLKKTYCHIPIIVLSDDLSEENVLELIEAGIDDSVPKKELSRLRQVICRILRNLPSHRHVLTQGYSADKQVGRYEAEYGPAEMEHKGSILFANMTEAFLYGKVICDRQGKPVDYVILDTNHAFELMTGNQRFEILNRRAAETNFGTNETEPDLIEICGRVAITGEKRVFECKMNYREKVYSVSAYSPCPGYFVSIFTDITEQKKIEAEIEKLAAAFERSPVMVIITNPDGIMEYINSKVTSVTGFSFKDANSRNINLLKSEMVPKHILNEMKEKFRNDESWEGEFISKKKNGELYWVSASVSPVRDRNGNTTNYILIQEDISDKKKFQQELEEKHRNLVKEVMKLKVMQKQKIQQEKLTGIGHLAAGAAHEINNPLGFVISNFDMLSKYCERFGDLIQAYRIFKNHIKNNEYQLAVQNISVLEELEEKYNIDFLLSDINDIFNDCNDGLTRITNIVSGLGTYIREEPHDKIMEYDLSAAVDNTLEILQSDLKQHAEVKKELNKVPDIQVMGDQINQVIVNLIENALYAISRKHVNGKGELKVRTYNDKRYVYCQIEDNGAGISKDNLNKIFDPFFTTKPVGQGSGMGLTIAYNIISRHNGQLSVESEYGKGTSFTFKLPVNNKPKKTN
ncbi:ATP-binding protein [Ruminiclostridium cellobioparum]|uniref:Stage 0 sporulation protein A homolog n=1 Tax=Ruminiclostridium cellobioparum subsp. termitidis CT1112 TaxID=1195236 RepID=S0FGE6_RUMCE|nr:ATP-binding protein [Ruminiclostridium cellobioparum]EMS70480.1 PAS domain S-box [Ruminiclostridium cellobioparum subsp. termitidis CT1112]